jgi:hypothetical protein
VKGHHPEWAAERAVDLVAEQALGRAAAQAAERALKQAAVQASEPLVSGEMPLEPMASVPVVLAGELEGHRNSAVLFR